MRRDHLWLLLAAAGLVALIWFQMALLGDTFWCLAAGDRFWATHTLPTQDPFTFTAAARPWILHMPLFQIGGAWTMRHLGPVALLWAGTLVYAGAQLVVWLSFARTTLARILTYPLVLFAVQVQAADICVRGQVLGDLAFAVLLVLLFRAGRGARVPLVAPVLLGVLWANSHPSFLLGLVFPVAVGTARLLDPPPEPADTERGASWLAHVRMSALFAIGTLLNPYSFALLVDVVKLAGNATTANVDLFRSPPFHDPWWAALLVVTVVLVGARALAGGRRVRSELAILVALFAATCQSRRYGALLTAYEIALAGRLLGDPMAESFVRRFRLLAPAAVGGGIAAVACLVLALHDTKRPFRDVPVAAAQAVEDQDLPGHVIDLYHWGGYLDWAWQGRRKIAYDGRNQLFDDGTFDDMSRLASVAPGWPSVLEMYEADVVLWESGAPLDRALAGLPGWREVHRDPLAVVYRRIP